MKRVIKTERDELEWIYIPDITYCEYGDVKRRLQLIVPYRQEWKGDRKYPLVVFIPGSAWYRQEMYNGIPGSFKACGERDDCSCHTVPRVHKSVDYYELEGANHGGAPFWSNTTLDIISDFIRQ